MTDNIEREYEIYKKAYLNGIEFAIDFISYQEGWEENGDKYREKFGLKTKFK